MALWMLVGSLHVYGWVRERTVRGRELLFPTIGWRRDMLWAIVDFTSVSRVESCVMKTHILVY